LRICDPPFAKTRLTAQTFRSVAEIGTNLTEKASLSSLYLSIFLNFLTFLLSYF